MMPDLIAAVKNATVRGRRQLRCLGLLLWLANLQLEQGMALGMELHRG